MVIHVYRVGWTWEQPEVYCITGKSKEGKVGSVKFSAAAGSFIPTCGKVLAKPYNPELTKKCCK